MQVEFAHGLDAVLDALAGEFGEGFVDGDEGKGGVFAARFVAVVGVEVTGEDCDEVRALVFAAAHFATLFIDADGAGIGVADVGDEEVVVVVLTIV